MRVTTEQRQDVVAAIMAEHKRLGSFNSVAKKCGVNIATISNNIVKPDNWHLVSDDMWAKVGKSLGVKFGKKWNVAPTTNTNIVSAILRMAQDELLWIPISAKAGSGKTAGIAHYRDNNEDVFVLTCEEWSRRAFLLKLLNSVGASLPTTGYLSVAVLGDKVVEFFKQRAAVSQPLLVLDEADKLRPSALRWLIHLYNKLEDEVGVVIAGTENLKKEIKAGVNRAVKGYDELDSRLGRTYQSLLGATKADVAAIAMANGLSDEGRIERIWREAEPVQRVHQNSYVTVVEDMRRLKRIIQRETLL